ncbi:iron complex outermembrane receptor protein [Comamonas odontotermitis]|uniref:Iron complex outermembrane receptor protein n=2 Tax=Comamonas odontotermitis TaxID=379895 RepID=A0ABR6RBZ8_9BURK|nr:iron complex outermembrane receptor protein [Comamonas odontotermitis]
MKTKLLGAHKARRLHGVAAAMLAISPAAWAQSAPAAPTAPNSPEATLSEVKVQAAQDKSQLPRLAPGGQVGKAAGLGLLGNVDTIDAPFNITAYSSELMQDQNASTVAAVLENDPSVRFTTNTGHINENYLIRGFDINASEVAMNGLYGIAPDSNIPTEFIERVELLKGPGALLSGMSPAGGVGGVVNIVTKRPTAQPLTRVTTSFTSGSQLQAHADVSRRFGPENRLGIRFNGLLGNGETSVDDQKRRRNLGALALDYQGDRFSLGLDAYHYRAHMNNGSPVMVSFAKMDHLIAAPDGRNNLFRGVNSVVENEGVVLRGSVDLNDRWQLFGSAGRALHHYEGQPTGTRVVLNAVGDGSAVGQTYNLEGFTNTTAWETGVRGSFETGSVKHQVVVAYNFMNQKSGRALPITVSPNYTTNIYDPVDPIMAPARQGTRRENDNDITSLALADTLSFAQDKVLLTLGLRHQRVHQKMKGYDESAVTPAAGLVVKPWGDDVSLYANYIQGLSPGVEVGSTYANAGEVFPPYKTKQMEMGVKWRAGAFTNTLALFQIEKPSTVIDSATNTLQLGGEQRNRGVEWNTSGEALRGLRVLGGIAYLQPRLTGTQGGKNDGNDAFGAARWTANLGGDWDIPGLPGAALSGRVVHTGKQWVNAANTLRAPSWTRVDLGARYATTMAGKRTVFRANVDNAFDRKYWAGAFADNFLTVGAPRTYRVSASVDF